MELNYFKDKLFDLLNDSESMDILDIITEDRKDKFTIITTDGSIFEIECRQLYRII